MKPACSAHGLPQIPSVDSTRMCALPEPSMFAQLLERLAVALDRAEIPYMIIGGQAVLLLW